MEFSKFLAEQIGSLVNEEIKKFRKGEYFMGGNTATPLDVMLRKSGKRDDRTLQLQKMSDDVLLTAKVLGVAPQQTKVYKRFKEFLSSDSELQKAMSTSVSGSGAEWIPTDFSQDLVDLVTLGFKVAAIHPMLIMTTKAFDFPRKTSRSTLKLKHTENTAVAASNPGTGKGTLTAQTLAVYVPFSYETEEDAFAPMLPMLKMDIAEAVSAGVEDAIINGDNSVTHMDSDVTSADDVRKAWKGYRKLVTSACMIDCSGTLTIDKIRAARTAMGIYGTDVSQIVGVTGPKGNMALVDLVDSSGNRVTTTVDKYGPNATILTGEVGKVDGISTIASEKVRENLGTTGYYTGTGNSKTVLILVRKDGFVRGDRRKVLVETDKDIKAQTIDLVASVRQDFQSRYPSTETIVSVLYNF